MVFQEGRRIVHAALVHKPGALLGAVLRNLLHREGLVPCLCLQLGQGSVRICEPGYWIGDYV